MKKWYVSKTLWVNALFLVAFILQGWKGYVLELEVQAAILVIVNVILRAITKEDIEW